MMKLLQLFARSEQIPIKKLRPKVFAERLIKKYEHEQTKIYVHTKPKPAPLHLIAPHLNKMPSKCPVSKIGISA